MSIRSALRHLVRRFGYELTPVEAALARPVKADYAPILELVGSYSFKFLDVKTFLPTTIQRAYVLGLHDSPSLDVLDIGTGVGFFPVVCRYYGHRAIALDRDGNEVFSDACRWLDVDRRSCEIHRFEPIPTLGKRFDLITGFMVNFDRIPERDLIPWSTAEWEFLLRDLATRHLKQHGRIAFVFNAHTLDSPEVLQFFRDRGAKVSDGWAVFEWPAVARF